MSLLAWYESLMAARGLFRGQAPHAPTSSPPPETPLKQQKPGLLPSWDDEAILIALDAGVRKLQDGLAHLRRIESVSAALRPDQRRSWRFALTSVTLTEKFEQVRETDVITRGGNNQNPPGRGGLGRIERKYGRRPLDYEFGPDDPRIQHLLLISELVETGGANGVQNAVNYLLRRDFIKAKSAKMELGDTVEAVSETFFRGVASVQLGDTYDVIMRHQAPGVDVDAIIGRALDDKLRNKKAAHTARKAERLPRRLRIRIAVCAVISILGITALFYI